MHPEEILFHSLDYEKMNYVRTLLVKPPPPPCTFSYAFRVNPSPLPSVRTF